MTPLLRHMAMIGLALLIMARLMVPAYAAVALQSDDPEFPDFLLASICFGTSVVDENDPSGPAVPQYPQCPQCPLCVMVGNLALGTPSSNPVMTIVRHADATDWPVHAESAKPVPSIDPVHQSRAPPFSC